MNKILYSILILGTALSMQSCLHDEDEVFDTSADQRLQQAVSADREVLESAQNGWVMHYYTGRNYTGGGYSLLMKFKDGKAQIASDNTGSEVATSSYTITKEQGPVLAFDTYNTVMHSFSAVSISDVDGDQGDDEFIIQKISQDKDTIWVEGHKWGNKMEMTRLPEGTSWQNYLNSLSKIKDDMWYSYKVMNGQDSLAQVMLNPDTRRITVTDGTGTSSSPYYVTPTGIGFPSQVILGKDKTKKLTWNATDSLMTVDGSSEQLRFFAPEGWHPIDYYAHNWRFYYNNWKGDLKLFCKKISGTKIEGSFTGTDGLTYKVILTYNKAYGSLSWLVQDMEDPSGTYDHLQLMAIYTDPSSKSEYITWAPGVGLEWKLSNGSFVLADNGKLGGATVSGFVIDGVDASGNRANAYPVVIENFTGAYAYPYSE